MSSTKKTVFETSLALAKRIADLQQKHGLATLREFAEKTGLSLNTIKGFLRRGRIGSPSANKIAFALKEDAGWIRTGVSAGAVVQGAVEFIYVHKAKARAAAGSGMVPEQGLLAETYGFRRAWLAMTRTSSTKLMLVQVTGSSMVPVLEDGDLVLVDGNRCVPQNGRYFVITVKKDDELRIKRLDKLPSGKWRATSLEAPDDPNKSPAYDEGELWVHGEVIWLGRTVVKP